MKNRFLNKLESSEQYAGISLVCLMVLSLLMPLATVLMLTLFAFLAWRKPERFVLTALAYNLLPVVVAFAAHHSLFGQHCLLLWLMGLLTSALMIAAKKQKVLPVAQIVLSVTTVAFVLSVAVSWFFPQIEAYWRENYLQLIQQLSLQLPENVLVQIKQSRLFVLETGWSLMLIAEVILISLALGLYLSIAMTKDSTLLKVLQQFSVNKWYAITVLVYGLLLVFFQPAWLLAGLPIVVVPFALAGLSLCLAKGWLRQVWWFAIWVSIVILLFALIQNPMLIALLVPLFVLVMLTIALLGFVDTWFNFRSKSEC